MTNGWLLTLRKCVRTMNNTRWSSSSWSLTETFTFSVQNISSDRSQDTARKIPENSPTLLFFFFLIAHIFPLNTSSWNTTLQRPPRARESDYSPSVIVINIILPIQTNHIDSPRRAWRHRNKNYHHLWSLSSIEFVFRQAKKKKWKEEKGGKRGMDWRLQVEYHRLRKREELKTTARLTLGKDFYLDLFCHIL